MYEKFEAILSGNHERKRLTKRWGVEPGGKVRVDTLRRKGVGK